MNIIKDKKIIALLPIKNESWILPTTLSYLSSFCDAIIIGDQMSTDGSREIYKQFPKVKVVDNKEEFHSNKIRWQLLDEARKIDGENILILLDADEFIPTDFFEKKFQKIITNSTEGACLEFKWINLWKNNRKYRSDKYWKKLTKPAVFIDDKTSDYNRTEIINDHTARIPNYKNKILIATHPIIHIEFLYWKKTQTKQAWYRCAEFIKDPKNYKKINYKYKDSKDSTSIKTTEIKKEWLEGLNLPKNTYDVRKDWRYKEIIEWFKQYGIALFEPLDIWHIKELENEFIKQVGRKPVSKNYPNILMKINDFKNYIKNLL